MKCIVALGNPGRKYQFTRHNVGFLVAEVLSKKISVQLLLESENFFLYKFLIEEQETLLLLPQTFMNLSGRAVVEIQEQFQLQFSDFLIVYDDFQIPFGMLRMRTKGSDGGHNGMSSIIYELLSEEIPRLRVGVGGKDIPEKHSHEEMADYVLSSFSADEQKLMPEFCSYAADACLSWIQHGITKTMSSFNRNFFNDANAS